MIEDPSIERVSKLEAVRLWGRIEAAMRTGTPFFTARERILADEIPDISKAYGAEVGKRITRAILSRHPVTASKETRQALREQHTRFVTVYMIEKKGRLSWMDRICLKLFGMTW